MNDIVKKNSLKQNALLNIFKVSLTVLFPLISFPYVSRILGPNGIGEANFAISIISYFKLFATLGINTYAISYGSKLRDNKKSLEKFVSEIFSFNILTTFISILSLIIILFNTSLQNHSTLILIESISVIAAPFGMIWLFNILEDYKYITIRYIFVQIVSLVLIFTFVRSSDDVVTYLLILASSVSLSNIINFYYARTKLIIHFKIQHIKGFKKHIKPLLMIFFTSMASTIYLNSDITILGLIKTDFEVGLYSAAVKINRIVILIISAVNSVLLPRLSYYVEKEKKDSFQLVVNKAINIMLFITIPAIVGMYFYSKELIFFLSGDEFSMASPIMKILSFNLLFSTFSGFLAYQIMIPFKKEKIVMIATILSASLNVLLNILVINRYGAIGAAYTTLISEFLVFIILLYYALKRINIREGIINLIYFSLSSVSIILFRVLFFPYLPFIEEINLVLTIMISMAIYFAVLIILKNKFVLLGMKGFFMTIKKFLYKKK